MHTGRGLDGVVPRGGAARKVSIAAGLVAMVTLPAWYVGSTLLDRRQLKIEWNILGPPCPAPPPPSSHPARWRGEQAFEYGGARFSRQFGAVNCAAVPAGSLWSHAAYPVCQFTGPGQVAVSTATGEARFVPGKRHATVAVRDGAATCVLAGWFQP